MAAETIGIIVVLFIFLLMFLRIPIAISMILPAMIGILYLRGEGALLTSIDTIIWSHSYSYTLSMIPMFLLMGEMLNISGVSRDAFHMFKLWMSRLRGGLAMATIGASAVFAAASGSSVATTGTMGVVTSKEMLNAGYNRAFSSGAIVAGGTLGILIPPSTAFIIYGMLSEQSIGRLLIAGIIPGIILALLFMITIAISVKLQPSLAPKMEYKVSWKEKMISLKAAFPVLVLFIIVIGGMYAGYFSPTEASGVGALGTFLIALIKRKMTFTLLVEALWRTLKTTGFIFAIVISAFVLNYFLTLARLPVFLSDFISSLNMPGLLILIIIICIYIILGALMDTLAMIVITTPIVLPVITGLGYDLIWFGVLICVVTELALISPPIGMNCFVLKGVNSDLNIIDIFKGALRFVIPILVMIALLIAFPAIATFLPIYMN